MLILMKAIVCTRYGSPEFLKLVEVATPTPKENEILVRIHSSTVQAADWRIQSLTLPKGMKWICRLVFGFSKPRQGILGTELSGTVIQIGKRVSRFKVGDLIVATTGAKFRAHAEFITLAENGSIFIKPQILSFQQAAALSFGGTTAMEYLVNKAALQPGEHLLANGASGPVGLAAIQLAKHLGARVTAVCSEEHFGLMKSLGADQVIDYTKEDFRNGNQKFDVIMDIIGTLRFSTSKKSLNPKGRFLIISGDLLEILLAPWQNLTHSQNVIAGVTPEDPKLLGAIVKLAEKGQFKSIIDQEFPLEKTSEAFAFIARRHKKGNLIINMQNQ